MTISPATIAKELLTRANEQFFDKSENLYYFTSDDSESLIARKKEFFDNVIPSSNSIMTWNLVHLGTHFYDEDLISKGHAILGKVSKLLVKEPEYLSNWAVLGIELMDQFAEIVIVGDDYENYGRVLNQQYLPDKIVTAAKDMQPSPLFDYKEMIDNKTTVYVCYNKTCKRPVTSVEQAIAQLKD